MGSIKNLQNLPSFQKKLEVNILSVLGNRHAIFSVSSGISLHRFCLRCMYNCLRELEASWFKLNEMGSASHRLTSRTHKLQWVSQQVTPNIWSMTFVISWPWL